MSLWESTIDHLARMMTSMKYSLGNFTSRSAAVFLGEINLPGMTWECHTADISRLRRFLKHLVDNFLVQLLREITREGVLLPVHRQGLMGEVSVDGHLGHSDQEVVEFKVFGDRRKTATKSSTLDMGKAEFKLFGELVCKIP